MTLQKRITLIFMLALLLVSATLIITGTMMRDVVEDRFFDAAVSGKQVLWKKIVDSSLDQMEMNTTALTRNRDALKALKKGNDEQLKDSLTGTFNRLSTSGIITQLEVVDAEGKRIHALPESSSDKANPLVKLALSEGKVQRDLVYAGENQLLASVVFPLYSRGKIVGAGVYLFDLQMAMADFQLNDESDLFLFNKGKLLYSSDTKLGQRLALAAREQAEFSDNVSVEETLYSVTGFAVKNQQDKLLAKAISVKDRTESYNHENNLTFAAIGVGAMMILLILGGAYWYLGSLFSSLRDVAANLQDIAEGEGDLRKRLTVTSSDETGQVAEGFNKFASRIQELIGQVNESSVHLSASSVQVASIASETENGVNQQQNETQQLATAMHQMTATVSEVSQNAQMAADAACQADEQANIGKQDVLKTIDIIEQLAKEVEVISDVIGELNQKSDEIGSVIEVIGGIAEQTNLLALNAAIEAARAGEQGRGFAVVADEVRTLAGRTQQSTQEIKDNILRLQEETARAVSAIAQGREQSQLSVEQVNKAGSSLEQIAQAISVITDMNHQIASASEEQLAVSQEIDGNVSRINDVSINTAQGASQLTESSQEMKHLVESLRGLVGQFKV